MKKMGTIVKLAFLIAVFSACIVQANASNKTNEYNYKTKFTIFDGKKPGTPSYMGMVAVHGTPPLSLGNYYMTFDWVNVHTSHGAYFPKAQLYTGLAAEYIPIWNMVSLSPHLRYYYCTGKRVSGYVGLEAGVMLVFPTEFMSDNIFYACAEVGFTVNFNKVSLDFGIRASHPLMGSNTILLPLRIGIIF